MLTTKSDVRNVTQGQEVPDHHALPISEGGWGMKVRLIKTDYWDRASGGGYAVEEGCMFRDTMNDHFFPYGALETLSRLLCSLERHAP